MPYVSLYRKYRPKTFSEILGQEHVSKTLANAIAENRVAHAYLFTGPRGTGKTSTARVLAMSLNCERGPTPEPCGVCTSCVAIAQGSSMDVFELDAASHSGVDETREILAGVPLATAGARKKVYVIDEVHMLTTQSFNALLKTLEEPPDHVVFVLATTEAHKVLPTIVSRTQRFDFRRIPTEVLAELVERVAKLEGIDIEPDAIEGIARHSEGGARDALSALDQIASLGQSITAADVEGLLGERGEDAFVALFDALADGDVGRVFVTLDAVITQGADVRQLALGALQHARTLLLLKTAPGAESLVDAPEEDRERLSEQASRFRIGGLLRTLDLVGVSVTEMRNAPNHRLFLEVALARAASPETDPAPEAVLARIERLERRLGIEAPRGPGVEGDGATQPLGPQDDEAGPANGADGQTDSRESAGEAAHDAAPGPSSEQATSAEHIGLSHIRDAWPAALKEVNKRSRRVGAYLNPSQPVTYDDQGLVVEVQSSFHASSMARRDNQSVLADAIQAALGIRPALRFAERGAGAPSERGAGKGEPKPQPGGGRGGTHDSGQTHRAGDPAAPASAPPTEGAQESREARPVAPAREQSSPEAAGLADYVEAVDATGPEHDPIELVKRDLGAEVVKEIERGDRA